MFQICIVEIHCCFGMIMNSIYTFCIRYVKEKKTNYVTKYTLKILQ